MSCKRKYVKDRFENSKLIRTPNFLHQVWHAFWTCAMCSGFQLAFFVAVFDPTSYFWLYDWMFIGGLNWILHCIEDRLFINI